MNLPPISLPAVELPFAVPTLMHPPVDHFLIALPVVVLIIEIINLFMQRRALSVLSLFFLTLTMVFAVAAYITGTHDGSEAFELLSPDGQAELKFHKLLGTYLMLFSGVVFIFKLLSMMLRSGVVKGLYVLLLIAFVAGLMKQGKDGGELVYEHGANVEKVKILDDKAFDLQDELDEVKEDLADKTKELEEAQNSTEEEAAEPDTPVQESNTTAETNSTN